MSATCALGGERRVAAGEDQAQAVVAAPAPTSSAGIVTRRAAARPGVPVVAGGLAPDPVDRAVAGRRDDPPGRVRRHAALRPALERDGEGVLDRLLGEVDVAEEADQGGDGAPALLRGRPVRPPPHSVPAAQDAGSSWKGRTSTGALAGDGALAAQLSAASRSATLMIQKPPSCSLVSANGPSVVQHARRP